MRPFESRVKCPCAATPPPLAKQKFLDFGKICFPECTLNFLFLSSRFTKSRYPPPGGVSHDQIGGFTEDRRINSMYSTFRGLFSVKDPRFVHLSMSWQRALSWMWRDRYVKQESIWHELTRVSSPQPARKPLISHSAHHNSPFFEEISQCLDFRQWLQRKNQNVSKLPYKNLFSDRCLPVPN